MNKRMMDKIMKHETNKYNERLEERRNEEIELELEVLAKRAECLKTYDNNDKEEYVKMTDRRYVETPFSLTSVDEFRKQMDYINPLMTDNEEKNRSQSIMELTHINETRPLQTVGMEDGNAMPPPMSRMLGHNQRRNTNEGIRRMTTLLSNPLRLRQQPQ